MEGWTKLPVDDDAGVLVSVKNGLAAVVGEGVDGRVYEAVPEVGVVAEHAEKLDLFAKNNPMYHRSYRRRIGGVECTVYEGDIDEYWLGSTGHVGSCAPFSPTWMCSALLLAARCAESGFTGVVDVGSGDGRVAYCARLLGLDAYSIEIDGDLADLQRRIVDGTGVCFEVRCADAVRHDYGGLGVERPAFCVGGLAQMGGEAMASGIIRNVRSRGMMRRSGFVLAGTRSSKYAHSESDAGWGGLIRSEGMTKTGEVCLPTAWTFGGKGGDGGVTPYVFAGFA